MEDKTKVVFICISSPVRFAVLMHLCQGKRRLLTEETSSQRYWRGKEYLFLGQCQLFADITCLRNWDHRIELNPKQCHWIWIRKLSERVCITHIMYVSYIHVWNHRIIKGVRDLQDQQVQLSTQHHQNDP